MKKTHNISAKPIKPHLAERVVVRKKPPTPVSTLAKHTIDKIHGPTFAADKPFQGASRNYGCVKLVAVAEPRLSMSALSPLSKLNRFQQKIEEMRREIEDQARRAALYRQAGSKIPVPLRYLTVARRNPVQVAAVSDNDSRGRSEERRLTPPRPLSLSPDRPQSTPAHLRFQKSTPEHDAFRMRLIKAYTWVNSELDGKPSQEDLDRVAREATPELWPATPPSPGAIRMSFLLDLFDFLISQRPDVHVLLCRLRSFVAYRCFELALTTLISSSRSYSLFSYVLLSCRFFSSEIKSRPSSTTGRGGGGSASFSLGLSSKTRAQPLSSLNTAVLVRIAYV
ncbi:hypothetical protein EJ04DRAFT_306866 [Polyplosphaeria fusca]|uniref:Uncharacterized protein n=1 Tax=Polyplosphaeria fusca TaxID=682080 RepID=A0A9P4QWF7_9PLEO|nr:hypothetical protein EJ04DRAFT_306866 [Polyplosphaeria fusca]